MRRRREQQAVLVFIFSTNTENYFTCFAWLPPPTEVFVFSWTFSFSLLPLIRKKKCVRGVLFSLYFLSLSPALLLLHPSSPLVLSFFSARVRFLSEYVYSKVFSPALSLFSRRRREETGAPEEENKRHLFLKVKERQERQETSQELCFLRLLSFVEHDNCYWYNNEKDMVVRAWK